MERTDVIIIGAGIAGASAGYALSETAKVNLLERESQPGYHATGRSAAVYTQAYGNRTIRALTVGGYPFFAEPPQGFAEHPILTPRGVMFVGRADQAADLDRAADEARQFVASVERLTGEQACARVPILRPDVVAGGVLEPEAKDIDVHGLHQGYLRGLRHNGGTVTVNAEVLALDRDGADWRIETKAGAFSAPVVVVAAGAWCDEIAALAGVAPIGLVPKRRTAFNFAAPEGADIDAWPAVIGVAEDFYFKPDAGQFLGSPADETPMPPCDIQPDELDIAIAVDRIQQMADIEIRRIAHKWAGLRSFVPDKTLVAGFDPDAAGFFWLAGQGGYGIQTSRSMGRITAALAQGQPIPSDLVDLGVEEAALSPKRFRAAA